MAEEKQAVKNTMNKVVTPTSGLTSKLDVQKQESKKDPAESVALVLSKMSGELQKALPKHMTAARLARVCMTLIRSNPKLLDCTRESLYGAIFLAAQMGMEPGPMGLCYIIPYGKKIQVGGQWREIQEAQFQIGYKGCLKLLRNSGEISNIAARVVHKNDKFRCSFGLTDDFFHEPNDEDPGPPVKAYVMAKFKDGGYHIELMNIKEIYEIRNKSQAYRGAIKYNKTDTPWIENEDEMIRKTVLKRACKYLPLSVEIMDQISSDEVIAKADVVGDMITGSEIYREEVYENGTSILAINEPAGETESEQEFINEQ